VNVLTSPLLTVPHGFPTREGGVSQGAYASLNCSLTVGDARLAVEENLERLATIAQLTSATELRAVTQVHGSRVVWADDSSASTEADALWTSTTGRAVGVRTADCVPILIEDRVGRRVAAAHAGWRGVEANIVLRTIDALEQQGSSRAHLRFAIGPCIEACCFEVDPDLATRFAQAFGAAVVVPAQGGHKPHLDLRAALVQALDIAGVLPEQVSCVRGCTSCEARFFSHRRDRGVTGRHLSFVTCQF
jgi:YfiH family protein